MARKANDILVRYNSIKDPKFFSLIKCLKGSGNISSYISSMIKLYLVYGKVFPVMEGNYKEATSDEKRLEQAILLDEVALSKLNEYCETNGMRKPTIIRDIVSRFVVYDTCTPHIVLDAEGLRQKILDLSNNAKKQIQAKEQESKSVPQNEIVKEEKQTESVSEQNEPKDTLDMLLSWSPSLNKMNQKIH